jgi:hypothetical protein
MEMDRNPWESEDTSSTPSQNLTELDKNPWEVGTESTQTRKTGGLSLNDINSMSLVGSLKGTKQVESPFLKPEAQPIMDLNAQRNIEGRLTDDQIQQAQIEEARANVENLYNRYSTTGNLLLSPFSQEAKAQYEADVKLVRDKTIEELRANGIPVDYKNDQLYTVDSNGNEVQVDDVGLLKTLNKSKFEITGAMTGGALAGMAAAKNIPTAQGKIIGAAAFGLAGGAVGAYEGARLDGLLNRLNMVTKVDDSVLYDKMKDAGIADIVMGPVGAGVAKSVVGAGKLSKQVFDFVAAGNQNGAVDAMLKHIGIDEVEARQRVKQLEDLIGPLRGMNDKEKILYTLTQTVRGGEGVAQAAAALDPVASTTLANIISKRAEETLSLADNLATTNNQHIFNQAMESYTKETKDFYRAVKDAPTEVMQDFRFNLDDLNIQGIIDDIDNGIANPFTKQRFTDTKKLINDAYEGGTFNDLIDLRQALNDVKFNGPKLKFKESELLDNVIKRVDSEIDTAAKTHIPEAENWLNSWSKAKSAYSEMKQVESNVMYKALTKPGLSEDQAVNIFSKYIKAGDNTFYQVMDKLPENVQNRIEGSVLNKLVNQFADGIEGSRRVIHFPGLAEELGKVSWQNPQSKQLVRTINRMADVFKNDVHLAAVSGKIQLPRFQSYLTADPVIRLKMEVASSIFNTVKQFMPTQGADTLAMAKHLGRILENPVNDRAVKDFMRAMPMERRTFRPKLNYSEDLDNLKQAYVARKIAMEQMFNKDIPPRLVWRANPERLAELQNPQATILPSVDDVLHISAQGNVARSRDAIWDYESQQALDTKASDLITEFIWRNTEGKQSDKIVEAATKYMDDARATKIMQNVASKLSKDDKDTNAKLVANAIKSEAGILIKRIEQDFGIKMPKDQADKLIALKFNEIMKGCQ